MIKIEVQSTQAVVRYQEQLTVGLRGAKAHFVFGEAWNGLAKTAVFRQGDKTVAVANVETEVTVPWEVLTRPGLPVQIGVYGTDGSQVAIPTVWAETKPVCSGTDPEADPSSEPTPGLWEQMQGKLEELETKQSVCVITVTQNANGEYQASGDADMICRALEGKQMVVCYWYDKDTMLHLADFQHIVGYTFTAVTGGKEYCIVIRKSGVITGTVTPLASGNAQDAVLYTPQELSPEQQAQARENIKSNQIFHLTFEVEETQEPVSQITIPLPVDLYNAVVFNIHGIYPQLSTAIELYAIFNSSWCSTGTVPVTTLSNGASGSNFHAIKQANDRHVVNHTVAKDYHHNATIGTHNVVQIISKGSTSVRLIARGENASFPVGTTFEIWGVYHQ